MSGTDVMIFLFGLQGLWTFLVLCDFVCSRGGVKSRTSLWLLRTPHALIGGFFLSVVSHFLLPFINPLWSFPPALFFFTVLAMRIACGFETKPSPSRFHRFDNPDILLWSSAILLQVLFILAVALSYWGINEADVPTACGIGVSSIGIGMVAMMGALSCRAYVPQVLCRLHGYACVIWGPWAVIDLFFVERHHSWDMDSRYYCLPLVVSLFLSAFGFLVLSLRRFEITCSTIKRCKASAFG